MIQLNLFEQTTALKQQCDMLRKAEKPITIDETSTFKFLYKQISRALNFANKNCTKVRTGQVAYSPEVQKVVGKGHNSSSHLSTYHDERKERTSEIKGTRKYSITQDLRHLLRWMRHLMH